MSVKDFGAKGDGSTDDTAAFNAALAASLNVSVPAGTYKVAGLTVNSQGAHLSGACGTANPCPRLTSATGAILTISATNVEADHLVLDGQSSASCTYGLLMANNSQFARVHDMMIENCRGTPGYGIANVDRSYASIYDHLYVAGNNGGIYLIKVTGASMIRDSTIVRNFPSRGGGFEVQIGDGTQNVGGIVTIAGCDIESSNPGPADNYDIIAKLTRPLVIRDTYFEQSTTPGSAILYSTGKPSDGSDVDMEGVYASGEGTGDYAIVTDEPSDITLNNVTFTAFNNSPAIHDTTNGASTYVWVSPDVTNAGMPAFLLENTPTTPTNYYPRTALLQINSTTKGFIGPLMTTTQKNAIPSPPEGLSVYDRTLHAPAFYNGSAWASPILPTSANTMQSGSMLDFYANSARAQLRVINVTNAGDSPGTMLPGETAIYKDLAGTAAAGIVIATDNNRFAIVTNTTGTVSGYFWPGLTP